MKRILIFCMILLTCSLFAAASETKNAQSTGNKAFNFLGFSFRQPIVARYHMKEFLDYDVIKMEIVPGRIKMRAGSPNPDIVLGEKVYPFYSFGFFAFGKSCDTYGLRFSFSETNILATDTGLNACVTFSDLRQMNGIQTSLFGGKVETLYGIQLFPAYAIADEMTGAQFTAGMTMVEKGLGFTTAFSAIVKEEFTGIHCSVVTCARRFNGLIFSAVVTNAIQMKGMQVSFVSGSNEKLQGVQISALASYAKYATGVQVGGYGNKAESLNGVQIGGWNMADDLNGVQIGIFNQAKKSASGVQFGILNYMKGALVPWFPLFNIKL